MSVDFVGRAVSSLKSFEQGSIRICVVDQAGDVAAQSSSQPPQRLAELHGHVARNTARWVGSHRPDSEGGERPGQLSQTGQLSRASRAACSVSSYHSWAFIVARRVPLHPASLLGKEAVGVDPKGTP